MASMPNCSAFDSLLSLPKTPTGAAKYASELRLARDENRKIKRKVYDCILFGFEMDMLRLHMRTLEHVVDGFLVTESTTCFQTAKSKPAHLSDALAAGTWPAALAAKTAVKIVTLADGAAAGCKDAQRKAVGKQSGRQYSGRCYQTVQRFHLLELLLKRAGPDDLALISDVDEIASPSFVSLASWCAPFPPLSQWPTVEAHTGYLHLNVRQYKYGLHRDNGFSWWNGPRLYVAGWLRRMREGSLQRISTRCAQWARARIGRMSRKAVGGI